MKDRRRLIVDVSNITIRPDRFIRTGIQEVIYRILLNVPALRQEFPEWEIILLPRLPQKHGRHLNLPVEGSFCDPPPEILRTVEETLRLPSREIWGFDLEREYSYAMTDVQVYAWMAMADRLHFHSYLNLDHILGYIDPVNAKLRDGVSATIYDIIPMLFREYCDDNLAKWFKEQIMEGFARRAQHAVCISRNTALDVLESEFGPRFKKISYLPLAFETAKADAADRLALLNRLGLQEQGYVMALGSMEPRKNLVGLLAGFEEWVRRYGEQKALKLVLVGGTGWKDAEIHRRFGESECRERVIFPGYLSDPEVRLLMESSAAVAMLSLYEGYGLPVAQAYSLGVPRITTLGSSLPEACLCSGIFVDPVDQFSVMVGIQKALETRNVGPGSGSLRADWNWSAYTRGLVQLLTS